MAAVLRKQTLYRRPQYQNRTVGNETTAIQRWFTTAYWRWWWRHSCLTYNSVCFSRWRKTARSQHHWSNGNRNDGCRHSRKRVTERTPRIKTNSRNDWINENPCSKLQNVFFPNKSFVIPLEFSVHETCNMYQQFLSLISILFWEKHAVSLNTYKDFSTL